MAHVIDSLIVELGLEPKTFDKQQQETLSRWKRTQEEFKKGGEKIEDSGKSVGNALEGIRSQAIELFAAFTGGKGLIEFTTNLTHADAEIGRVSRSIGISETTISKWGAAARIFGGDARTMAQSFITMSDAFAGWKVGAVSPLIADFRAISTAGGKIIDMNKGVEQSFLDLAENLKNIHDSGPDGPAQAGLLGRRLGLDPAFLDILIKGPEATKKILDQVNALGPATKASADAAGELERRWNAIFVRADGVGRQAGLIPGILKLSDILNMTPSEAWDYFTNSNSKVRKPGSPLVAGTSSGLGSDVAAPSPTGAFTSQADKEAYIRAEAVRQGQNPDVWERLFAGEGRAGYAGDYDATGKPTSFGAFQLHYPGVGRNTADGLGTAFTKETGLDARDPNTEPQQIAWSMRYARTHGLSAWHGWHGSQWGNLQGSAGQGGGGATINNTTTIGDVHITAAPGADGAQIARDFRKELIERQSNVSQADYGQN